MPLGDSIIRGLLCPVSDSFQQSFIKFNCRVLTHGFQLLIQSRHLHQIGQVSSLPDRDRDMWNLDLQDFVVVLLQADPVDFRYLVPVLKCNDHVKALLETDAAHTINTRDVNDAEAAHFHVEPGKVGGGADELAAFEGTNLGHVVGDEAVTAFHQREDALAFADAAGAADEDADAHDVDHAAVLGGGGGKIELETNGGGVEQPHGGQGRLEDGDVLVLRLLEDDARRVDVAGEDQARDAVLEEFAQALAADRFGERLEILRVAA